VEVQTVVNPGELYWGEDPNAQGSEQKGRRLWLIISRRALNGNNTVVVVPVSTKMQKADKHPDFCILLPAGEIVVNVGQNASVDCVALCHQVRVLDKTRFLEQYGKLSRSAIPSVQLGLSYVFDL
jgi:mRNA interferase MazF